MKKLTHDEISEERISLESISKANKMPVYVLLNSIRSSYNVGSIFRSSDGAMIKKLYLCGYTPHPPKKEILKTALGSQDSVDWEYVENAEDVILLLKKQKVKIIALEQTDANIPYYEISQQDFPICLVVGNEVTGVDQKLIDLCDAAIEIPQYGIKQSLNVAVAYGVSVFELRKVYEKKK